jgi:hypothetical protein
MPKRTEIVEALQRLQNTDPLDPADSNFKDLYVENLHARGDDVIEKLLTKIDTSVGSQHAYLFSGTIGSGKSTELHRLGYKLRESGGNYSIVIDALNYLNPQVPPTIVDLLMAMALGVWEHCAQQIKGIDPNDGARWQWWKSVMQMHPELKEVELAAGPAKFKLGLRDNATFREKLRKHFAGGIDQLLTDVQTFFGELAKSIRFEKRLKDTGKLVLIVDSLEHFGGRPSVGKNDDVLQGVLDIFGIHGRALRIPGWSVVYSVPPLLPKLAPGIAGSPGMSGNYYLTSAHVFRDRSDTTDDETIDNKLVPLVISRLGKSIQPELIPASLLRDIVIMTGGDLRDLLRMVHEVLVSCLANIVFPATPEILGRVADELRRPYLPFPMDVAKRLGQIRASKEAEMLTTAAWFEVIGDLAQKRVLLYLNGTEWYDVHPLLREPLAKQLARQAASAPLIVTG